MSDSINSFDEEIRIILETNEQRLQEYFQDQPPLALKREFPRDCAIQPETEEEIMYTRDYPEYAEDPTQLPQQPDPWRFENKMYSDSWQGEQDQENMLACTTEWFEFIGVPITTLFVIRALLNNVINAIEIRGFMTPVGILKVIGDYIAKNWPGKLTRDSQTGKLNAANTHDMTTMIENFQLEIKNDLSLRSEFVSFNKFFTRRDNYTNWCKFSSLMTIMASELGPVSHNLCNEVVEQIDNIVAYQRLSTRSNAT